MKLDRLDKRILREIQRDGAITNLELAERIGCPPPPAQDGSNSLRMPASFSTESPCWTQKTGLKTDRTHSNQHGPAYSGSFRKI